MTSSTLSKWKNSLCIDKVDEGITNIAVVGKVNAEVKEVVISKTSRVKDCLESSLQHISCEVAKN